MACATIAGRSRRGLGLRRFGIAVALAAALGSRTASADVVTLSANDNARVCSFKTAGNWSNKKEPEPANDYVVSSGFGLWAPTPSGAETNVFAGGSITFGSVADGKQGVFDVRSAVRGSAVSFTNAVCENMLIDMSAGTGPAPTVFTLLGHYEVTALSMTLAGWQPVLRLEGDLSGLDTAKVLVNSGVLRANQSATLCLLGDNAEFHGQVRADGPEQVVLVKDCQALGASEGVRADAFLLCDGAAFGCCTDGETIQSSTRGVTFSGNAPARLSAPAGVTWTFALPYANNGTEMRKVGAGTLILKGLTLSKPVIVEEGALGFDKATRTSTLTVARNAGVVAPIDAESGTTIPVTIDEVLGWPIGVGLEGDCAVGRFAVAKIPVSLKEDLSAGDLFLERRPQSHSQTLAIEIESDDSFHTVYVRRVSRPLVRRVSTDSELGWAEPGNWSDNQPPHDDADYLVDNASVLPADTEAFGGASLTLSSGSTLLLKTPYPKLTTVSDLRLMPGVEVTAVNLPETLNGSITIVSTEESPVVMHSYPRYTITVAGRISGSGAIHVTSDFDAGGVSTVAFSGDNTGFRGRIAAYAVGSNVSSKSAYVKVTDDAAFGAVPNTLDPSAVRLGESGYLVVENDVTLAPTRGVTCAPFESAAASSFTVAPGCALTIGSSFCTWSAINKWGEGVLRLGGADNVMNNQQVVVRAGTVQPLTSAAFGSAWFNMGASTSGLAFDVNPADADLAARGVLLTRTDRDQIVLNNLPFNVTVNGMPEEPGRSFTLPLATFSSAVMAQRPTFAATLLEKLNLVNPPPRHYRPEPRLETLADGSCRLAIRYKFSGGMAVIVR